MTDEVDLCEVKRSHKTIDIFSLPEAADMAPAIKLTYFNVTALGEPTRMLLKYGNIDFEDKRFAGDEWAQYKPNMPFGQVPVYEEDGKIAHQSVAIARYVAKKVKLVGETDWENLEIDAIIDTINDFRSKIAQYHYEQDATIKESKKEPLFNETIPFYLERFDKIAEANKEHLALGKLTWADVFFVGLLDYLNFMVGFNLTENRPNLQAVVDNVKAIPAIKNWIETRPKTN